MKSNKTYSLEEIKRAFFNTFNNNASWPALFDGMDDFLENLNPKPQFNIGNTVLWMNSTQPYLVGTYTVTHVIKRESGFVYLIENYEQEEYEATEDELIILTVQALSKFDKPVERSL